MTKYNNGLSTTFQNYPYGVLMGVSRGFEGLYGVTKISN